MRMSKKLYWDDVNGKVTDDDKWAEIYCVNGGNYYVETYKIDDNRYIDFAYSKTQKKLGLYYYRMVFLKRHGLKDSDLHELVRLCVPEDVYKNAVREYSYLLDEGSETDVDSGIGSYGCGSD